MTAKKCVSLLCVLCMLAALLSPMLAMADDAGDASAQDEYVEPAATEMLAEIEPVETEPPAATEQQAGDGGTDGYTPEPAPEDELTPEPEPEGEPTPEPAPTTGFVPDVTQAPQTDAPQTDAPQATATAQPTEQPFQFPEELQILTDKRSVWQGDSVTYTIIGVDKDCIMGVYDPALYAENSPAAPQLMACTPNYPDPYGLIPRMVWNDELMGWQFTYTPQGMNSFQLRWRMFSGEDLLQYIDYTESKDQDIITVYAPPTIQIQDFTASVKAGDPVTMHIGTPSIVDRLELLDENGQPLPYVESITSEDMGQTRRWTCVFRFYEPGTHRICAQAHASLDFVERSVRSDVISISVMPSATHVPVPTLEPGVTPDPDATLAPELPPVSSGYVRFKQVPSADAKVGEEITLNLDVEFAGVDGQRINYTEEAFYDYVDYIEVQPEITGDPYPFEVDESLQRIIIRSYEEMQEMPFRFNVKVKPSLANGTYTFNFTLRYRLKGNEAPEADKTEAGMVFVTGAKQPSTGGGGGGGGGSALPATQAKLLVESTTTSIDNPKAGDTFDVILKLRNTNEKQFVQNIKVTFATDNDALLPAQGSSSFYIDRIDADGTYELKIPVTARPDIPDAPIKMTLTMEYEDRKVNTVSASQVIVLNVKQVQKLRLDELVLPQGEIIVGDTATFTMNVINSGRTTLYNVSAAMLESEQFMTAGSSYLGNLEAGSSKQVELDIYPNVEGPIDGTLRVTYEDANGNQTYEDTPFSIYASPMEQDDPGIFEPVIEPTPEPVNEFSSVLANLPWWVYGAAGLFVICVVMLIAVAMRRRKADSFMDYDDD